MIFWNASVRRRILGLSVSALHLWKHPCRRKFILSGLQTDFDFILTWRKLFSSASSTQSRLDSRICSGLSESKLSMQRVVWNLNLTVDWCPDLFWREKEFRSFLLMTSWNWARISTSDAKINFSPLGLARSLVATWKQRRALASSLRINKLSF